MKEFKHTPGPWSISRHWGPCEEHPEWASIDIGEDFKCASGHIGEANARLIAAAPDLLEALKLAEEMLCKQENAMRSMGRYEPCPEVAILTARAAITKATEANAGD